VGAVLLFSDPKTWSMDPEKLRLIEVWVMAVGVHPKEAQNFGDCYFEKSRLVDSPAVTFPGEARLTSSPSIYASGH